MNASQIEKMAVSSTYGKSVAPTVGPLPDAACPICGVPLPSHHITKWYGRRYDVWSYPMAARGHGCFVVTLGRWPDHITSALMRERARPPRGRPRKGGRR